MCLADYFNSLSVQIRQAREKIQEELRKDAISKGLDPLAMMEGDDTLIDEKLHLDKVCKDKQNQMFKQICRQVEKSSR